MTLGFYYHIPAFSSQNGLKVPSYLGVFLDALASEVDTLTLFMHEANRLEDEQCDYILGSPNIEYNTLGPKTPAWDRYLWPRKTLKGIKKKVGQCDILLVRGPSPLAPTFFYLFKNITRIVYLIVGDYLDGIKYLHQPIVRKLAIKILTRRNDKQLRRVLSCNLTLVNSDDLYEKYKLITTDLKVVRTTTISDQDFFYRQDTCLNNEINILYTGRLDLAKGLKELFEATAMLIKEGFILILHLAAWEDDAQKPIERLLRQMALDKSIESSVIFHGRRTLGTELNSLYRMADIYAIPSYHEGFPRTIWEAMANGLPVIASNVGSIPSFAGDAVLLVKPQNVEDIAEAVKTLILKQEIRQNLITRGYLRAKENTLDVRVKEICDILKSHLKNKV